MSFCAPKETDLRDALYLVCEQLKAPCQSFTPSFEVPLKDVGVEFIGPRLGVEGRAAEPDMSEQDKLAALENECLSDMTIPYIHGGGL